MRAFWSGTLAFGLVSIPVKLYSAEVDTEPHFHMLHKRCGTRIAMVRRCPACNKDLAFDECAKGYEVSKGQYALFTAEELKKLDEQDEKAQGSIQILRTVNPGEIPWTSLRKSYWVGPGGRDARSFTLLRNVLAASRSVAVGSLQLRTRPHQAVLRPCGLLFSLTLLATAEEMASAESLEPVETAIDENEMRLASKLVQTLSGPFEVSPSEGRSNAVLAAVDEKIAAGEVVQEGAAHAGGSLAEALQRSLPPSKKRAAKTS